MTTPIPPEQFLRTLLAELQDHFRGQYEPAFVGLARQYLASLPAPSNPAPTESSA